MNADGTGQTNLTNSPTKYDRDGSWSPGDERIAFTATPPNDEIYSIKADGTDRINLTNNGYNDFEPDWQSLAPDTDPPETTIDTGPSGTITDPTPSFTFSSDEPGSTFRVPGRLRAVRDLLGPRRFHTTAALARRIPHLRGARDRRRHQHRPDAGALARSRSTRSRR